MANQHSAQSMKKKVGCLFSFVLLLCSTSNQLCIIWVLIGDCVAFFVHIFCFIFPYHPFIASQNMLAHTFKNRFHNDIFFISNLGITNDTFLIVCVSGPSADGVLKHTWSLLSTVPYFLQKPCKSCNMYTQLFIFISLFWAFIFSIWYRFYYRYTSIILVGYTSLVGCVV